MSTERPWDRGPGSSDDSGMGRALIVASWVGTTVSCVTAAANAITGGPRDVALSAVPGLVMMAVGSVSFVISFFVAVGRSREVEIAVGGLYFLAGCAPRRVQALMMGSVAVQTIVPLGIAIARPFTAFSVLAPMWSLGLAGMWGAWYGWFPPRRDLAGSAGDGSAEPHTAGSHGPDSGNHPTPAAREALGDG